MNIAYGIDVQESDDPYISIAEDAMNGATQGGVIGAFWVNVLPMLKYVPSWFPGAGFQRKVAHWGELVTLMAERPFSFVKEQLVEDYSLLSAAHLSLQACLLTDDSAGKWQCHTIRGSEPY